MVLANENSPFFLAGGFCALPQQMAVLNLLPESFKSGMGLTYDQLGPEVNRGVERLPAPWFRTQLVPNALPRRRSRAEIGGRPFPRPDLSLSKIARLAGLIQWAPAAC